MISTIGALTTTYKGTIVVHNPACNQSATIQFKDSGGWKSLGSKKGVKNGVSHTHIILSRNHHVTGPVQALRGAESPVYLIASIICTQVQCEERHCQVQQ